MAGRIRCDTRPKSFQIKEVLEESYNGGFYGNLRIGAAHCTNFSAHTIHLTGTTDPKRNPSSGRSDSSRKSIGPGATA
jgi:hypothetical protein